jgi:hypothetical protein
MKWWAKGFGAMGNLSFPFVFNKMNIGKITII